MAYFTITWFIIFWIVLPSVIIARRNGADESACVDMHPRHEGGPKAQTTDAPFTIRLSKTYLTADEQLTITLEAQSGGSVSAFKGFLIQVRSVGGVGASLGTFERNADGTTKVINCKFGSASFARSAITHSINKAKMTVTVAWNPPRKYTTEQYQVYYTVVEKLDTFWVKVEHPQIITVKETDNTETGALVDINVLLKLRKYYSRCGSGNYGCFGVPTGCIASFDMKSETPAVCDMMVSWSKEHQVQNDFAIVSKLIGNDIGGYVALGLSKDDQMGDDSVAGCTFPTDNKKPDVKRYYNTPEKDNILYLNGRYGVHAYQLVSADGLIFCGFTQSDHIINDEEIDFNNEYYLMLSRGSTFTAKGLGVHPRVIDRAVTDTAIKITDYIIASSEAESSQLTFLHGSIMLFTWFVVAPTGAFTARYYKLTRVDRVICQRPFWYMTHITCMVATAFFTFIGAILIFVRKEWQLDTKYYHNIFGLLLSVSLLFQIVSAFVWPLSKENYRSIFRWIHYVNSVFLNCVAITCIIFVRELRLANFENNKKSHGRLWIVFSIIIIVIQALMHLIMTYHTYWADGEMNVNDEFKCRAITIGPLDSNGQFSEQPGGRFRNIMLLCYIAVSILTVVVLIFLIYYDF